MKNKILDKLENNISKHNDEYHIYNCHQCSMYVECRFYEINSGINLCEFNYIEGV